MSTKVSGWPTKLTAKDPTSTRMAQSTKASGKMTSRKAMVLKNGLIARCTKVATRIHLNMAKESSSGQMDPNTRETFWRTIYTATACTPGQTADNTPAVGRETKLTEL